MLKALDPNKYREKQATTAIAGDIIIKMAILPYDDEPKLPEANVIEGEAKETT